MRFTIEFSEIETLALRKFAAQQIASADDKSVIAAIRVILIDHLSIAGLLDRNQVLNDILNANMPNVTKVIHDEIPESIVNKPSKLILVLPEKIRANRETNTWKVFRYIIQSCLSDDYPVWHKFKTVEICTELSLEYKNADQGLRALMKGNWIQKSTASTYVVTEDAKDYLITNKDKLKELALLK
jgi:hypothetical protein